MSALEASPRGAAVWVFAYAEPFEPIPCLAERRGVVVQDWARRFWQGSPERWGTPEAPGRIATLLRWPGKSCRGVAWQLRPEEAAAGLAELDTQFGPGFQRTQVPVSEGPDLPPFAQATAWVATTSNPHFLGLAAPDLMATQIRSASGSAGANAAYVLALASHLTELGELPEDETFLLEQILRRS